MDKSNRFGGHAVTCEKRSSPIEDDYDKIPKVFFRFFGFFNKATAYTPKWIFPQSTSEHVVPGQEVPFGGLDNYI